MRKSLAWSKCYYSKTPIRAFVITSSKFAISIWTKLTQRMTAKRSNVPMTTNIKQLGTCAIRVTMHETSSRKPRRALTLINQYTPMACARFATSRPITSRTRSKYKKSDEFVGLNADSSKQEISLQKLSRTQKTQKVCKERGKN